MSGWGLPIVIGRFGLVEVFCLRGFFIYSLFVYLGEWLIVSGKGFGFLFFHRNSFFRGFQVVVEPAGRGSGL